MLPFILPEKFAKCHECTVHSYAQKSSHYGYAKNHLNNSCVAFYYYEVTYASSFFFLPKKRGKLHLNGTRLLCLVMRLPAFNSLNVRRV